MGLRDVSGKEVRIQRGEFLEAVTDQFGGWRAFAKRRDRSCHRRHGLRPPIAEIDQGRKRVLRGGGFAAIEA